jgi:hypothetical protein
MQYAMCFEKLNNYVHGEHTYVCLSAYKNLLQPAKPNSTCAALNSLWPVVFLFAFKIRNYVIFCAYTVQLRRFLLQDHSQNNS